MLTFVRIIYYLYRIFNSLRFLGFLNTIKIFFISKITSARKMNITLFNNKFFFRPNVDSGSYTRLTKSQYIIKGTLNQPIEIIIDAGSNIGSQAIRFINLNQDVKKIICIEPDKTSSEICDLNLKNYNAKVYNNALSNISDKNLTILNNINSEMSEIIEDNDDLIERSSTHEIKTISINDIVEKEKLDKIDFIKFDINGYEEEVFEKNTEWLNITNCIGFNNADINKTTNKIIQKFREKAGHIKIFNIDQMIFLMRENIEWIPIKGFMNSKKVGILEIDHRY